MRFKNYAACNKCAIGDRLIRMCNFSN